MSFASWMTRCAGNAARSSRPHARVGVSSNAASKIELGGQSVDTGDGWIVKAKPIRAPKKYPTHTSAAASNIDARSVEILLIPLSRLWPEPQNVRTPVARGAVHLQKTRRLPGLGKECTGPAAAALAPDQELAVGHGDGSLGVHDPDRARRGSPIGAIAGDRHLDIVLSVLRARHLEKSDPFARDARHIGDRDRPARCRRPA